MAQKHIMEVPTEDQQMLDRAVESNTVDSVEDALALGYRNVVVEQLDFEWRMRETIIPRMEELEAGLSRAISAEEMKRRLQQRRAARIKAA